MSMASRATTKAEEAILRLAGWYESNLESMSGYEGGLYIGNWNHPEVKDGHKGPDEAMKITRERFEAFKGEF